MILYKIEKPLIDEIDVASVLERFGVNEELFNIMAKTMWPKYLYWDKVKYLKLPETISNLELWALAKKLRAVSPNRRDSIVRAESGQLFTWEPPLASEVFNHSVDLSLGGSLVDLGVRSDEEKLRFMTRGIMDEAIASSQLEGANTTRKAAKMFLYERRKPKTLAEQMVLNNYETMRTIESEAAESPLSESMLFELHASLTRNTIDTSEIGRLRKNSDNIVVSGGTNGTIYHIPPDERFLRKEIARLVDYANDKVNDKMFIHPVAKAIIIHFWIGYLHPFTDGNGRLARALFYWYVLRKNYWAFTYLPLSQIIRKSPAQYRDAYSYTEQDDFDLTYFIDYNQRKILEAKKSFENYVKLKRVENEKFSRIARLKYNLNDRQLQILKYLHKNMGESVSIKMHARMSHVTRLTAVKDLKTLVTSGLLRSIKRGRELRFLASDDLKDLL